MTSPPSPERKYPSLPLKTRLYITVLTAATDICRRSNGTINRRLFAFLDFKASPNPKPIAGVRTADVQINPSRGLWMRLFVPSSATSPRKMLPVILFFHGGGFAYLSPASQAYDAVCRRISAALSAVVVSVNYRLSPEHRFASQYDDGADALRFLSSGQLAASDPEAAEIADLSNCFVAGDSAGGNLAHHVAVRWAAGRAEYGSVRVAGVVLIQPWFGGEERTEAELRLVGAPLVSTERTDWLWRAFLPEGEDRDHPAVNVFGPRAAKEALPEGFPPVAVVVGGYDPLNDWQRRYYEGLRKRGVEARLVDFPEAIHAFYVFPELPESGKLIGMIGEFIESHKSPAMAE